MRALWSSRVEHVAELVEHRVSTSLREAVVAPGLAHERLGALAVALRQQRAREREPALGDSGLRIAEVGAHGALVGAAPATSSPRPGGAA